LQFHKINTPYYVCVSVNVKSMQSLTTQTFGSLEYFSVIPPSIWRVQAWTQCHIRDRIRL